jgi:3-oxoacyl-[acyl-carrier-protein] synthase II
MRTEVVITGMGVICSQASSVPELFGRLKSGLSSVRNNAKLAAHGVANPACAYIDDDVWAKLEAEQVGRFSDQLGPQARLAVHAADQAVRHAGIDLAQVDRKGLFVASNKYTLTSAHLMGIGRHYNADTDKVSLDSYVQDEAHDAASYYHKRQDMAALALAQLYGFDDAIMTPGDACAAGGISVGIGYRHIAHGELDVALVGATETMSNYVPLMGFSILGACAPDASDTPECISRPFDRDRTGFVMGEGSAFLVLESLEHAQQRGATILGRISGFAKQAEAYRITASPSDGSQYARCMQAALDDAGLDAGAIDHINAHGTSTQQNDSCESAAIRQVFGVRAPQVPVTANKSALGHSLAASGAIEAVLSVMSLQEQTLLPTLNFREGDEHTEGLDIVQQARAMPVEHIMSNSFGFGGQNCVLILSTH